ncbi:MAG: hydroxyisourate hydrolase [Acidimicrobiia bacterium]|nr:hydroxyisourate hydrolase [Acidimicrobiia bacterium]
MTTISTHVLDTATGRPGPGVGVTITDDTHTVVGRGTTDDDGRVAHLADVGDGVHHLHFATGDYGNPFYPEVVVTVQIDGSVDHYHIPLLLSTFGYTTYRGS